MKRRFSIPQFVVYLAIFIVAGGALMGARPSNFALVATAVVLGVLVIGYARIMIAEEPRARRGSHNSRKSGKQGFIDSSGEPPDRAGQ